jgi:AcrR family transcriptional regulator
LSSFRREHYTRALGVSRASLYYVPRTKEKDWRLKVRLEEELQIHPSYGSRRLARALGLCRQRAQRVMRLFGIKPHRRRGRKWRKSKVSQTYPDLLLAAMPAYANHIWAADFTPGGSVKSRCRIHPGFR